MRLHPDYAAEVLAERCAWREEQRAATEQALRCVRSCVPCDVRQAGAEKPFQFHDNP